MEDKELAITIDDLPLSFVVKYLGWEPVRGLWGMKHTRKPIDNLVKKAKELPANTILPRIKVKVDKNGFSFQEITKKSSKSKTTEFGVNEISYGVQDIIYDRVFSMIIVTDKRLDEGFTFVCHSFVCDSTSQARQLTFGLAAVFEDYAKKMKESGQGIKHKKFAIDLRSPEQLSAEGAGEDEETDA